MTVSKKVTIQNKLGLHARAATKLAQLSQQFEAEVEIQQGEKSANADSVMALLMLASNQGKEVLVKASGAQKQEALDAICQLISNKFDETE